MIPKDNKNLKRLAIFYRQSRQKSIKNKFYSKAHCFRADFSGVKFHNVNFKGAIMTSCSFKGAEFSEVDFLGTNLKKSNFSHSSFNRCIFVNALFNKTNFKNCSFKNCLFVNTSVSSAKNININDSNQILKEYPTVALSSELSKLIDAFRGNGFVHNSRVLHLKGGKVNNLTLKLLLDRFGEEILCEKLSLLHSRLPGRVVTTNSLVNMIDSIAVIS